jgi:signal transduction histidine kinase
VPVTPAQLWPAFVAAILTITILLTAVGAAMILGRRRLARAHARFTAELVRVQDEERAGIAGEVHDDFGGHLALLGDALAAYQATLAPLGIDTTSLREAREEVRHLGEGIRNLAHRLHPNRVDKAGLPVAIRDLASELRDECRLSVTVSGLQPPLPEGPAGWALYRIFQESARNAARHGAATAVQLDFRHLDGAIEMEVRDDGHGFDVHAAETTPDAGIGLRLMRERAGVVGGTLQVESRPGSGTTIRCRIPFVALGPADA